MVLDIIDKVINTRFNNGHKPPVEVYVNSYIYETIHKELQIDVSFSKLSCYRFIGDKEEQQIRTPVMFILSSKSDEDVDFALQSIAMRGDKFKD